MNIAAAILWNSFPDNFKQESSFNQFKALISNWSGKDCDVFYVGSCSAGCPAACLSSIACLLLRFLCCFSFVCSILSLMLIHDGAVLAPAWIAGLNTAT